MVYRIFVEKKRELAAEARTLEHEAVSFLGIKGLESARVVNRYDVENISKELFDYAITTVFSEPQLDIVHEALDIPEDAVVFAAEYLPGQFDQRADSAAQCIQIISQGERPTVRTARIYILTGKLSADDIAAIKKYVINPVESREASFERFDTLALEYEIPEMVETLEGFLDLKNEALDDYIAKYGLAMDAADLAFCIDYFKGEKRCPTITELRMIDTYWSDHCRHTTFLTAVDSVSFADPLLENAYRRYLAERERLGRNGAVTLMDIATLGAKCLKADGKLDKLDESDEINACTVKIKITVDGEEQDWLLLFKNETHNHPTEIEPFGGAATCIGGAIRDPLSGRSYVYAAMRVTGAADPLRPIEQTLPGKLPQRKLCATAAAGYSSYGNQIGLATGMVDELYHDGYAAKRLEIGAVIGAAPAACVRRETPAPGDLIILLGGRTGRDGMGGATGSSKSHTVASLEACGAEVQKGNAPEERKLQRLFRNREAALLIKRCNDFGAGGVSVAIGELADGLEIDLNKIPKKYEGLDGTELAISESQERMAVVVAAKDAQRFMALAFSENLEATVVAVVTDDPRLVMHWNGKKIVDISREFLSSNGAEKHISVSPAAPQPYAKTVEGGFADNLKALAGNLNICSKRGLSERFDATIGAGTVLMPFGGKNQLSPIQAMVHKISVEKGHTSDCSFMSWGFNPYISEKSPYHGAYLAVVESVAKLIATGADFSDIYLTLQEFFEKPLRDEARWGKPFAALLGAFSAQLDLGVAAIGGKDSMSGSFETLDVPPTLVSFAVTTGKAEHVLSTEFKKAGSRVAFLKPEYDAQGLPLAESFKALCRSVTSLAREGKVLAAYTPGFGGAAEAVIKMCAGNGIGFAFDPSLSTDDLFGYAYGAFILELSDDTDIGITLGRTQSVPAISHQSESVALPELLGIYEDKLEPVYPCNIVQSGGEIPAFSHHNDKWPKPRVSAPKPLVLIPVFPGTNCEYDTAKALRDAGAEPEIIVINNLTASSIRESAEYFAGRLTAANIIFIPGGFSGGDEPEGSGKFITAFFRSPAIRDGIHELLKNRDGLICGVCNGFQALIKLGLLPYGEIIDTDAASPTLTYNKIGRHQSRIVHTRVASNLSPWLMETKPGDIFTVPVSHGEGRFLADDALILRLAENGQIATQYADLSGTPTNDIRFNPNGSAFAIEGITSPDGRVFGKMGHSERTGDGLYSNVDGNYDMGLFRSAVKYFG